MTEPHDQGCPSSSPRIDLRTPRSTFDTFCRAVLNEHPKSLWETIDPNLREKLEGRLMVEGQGRFFERMRMIICAPTGRLQIGEALEDSSHSVVCPLFRGRAEVGKAWFSFQDRRWVLCQLN